MSKLKIAYSLQPEEIVKTIDTLEKNPSGLVQKVFEKEATFLGECKGLIRCNEEEFYGKRDELVHALNLYDFGPIIEDSERTMFDYKLFHRDLAVLKKEKRKSYTITGSGFPTGTGLTILSAFLFGGPAALFVGMLSLFGAAISTVCGAEGLLNAKRYDVNNTIVLKTYGSLVRKSVDADNFMKDLPFLKEEYLPVYEKLKKDSKLNDSDEKDDNIELIN
ncbi:MAG: hypothetical protein ISS23_02025 [Nanoarchaeota archaeon]|nr:hypothetical protein [Nanoarchaeota archaeon]